MILFSYRLVFVDINDQKKRDKVLAHINIQAKETMRLNKMAKKRGKHSNLTTPIPK